MTMTEAEHKIAELFKNEEKPKDKKAKKSKKAKNNGERERDAKPVADGIVAAVVAQVGADHELGKRVKELRDTGMAWWQIAYQLEMPGSGPNVASGKAGAARARAAYKKTFGSLPGDVARRSTKASRAAASVDGAPVVRKPLFGEEDLADLAALVERVAGHEIRWIGRTTCADASVLESERDARVHPVGVTAVKREADGMVILSFREQPGGKGDRAEQWRSVYAQDIYDIRR